MFYPVLTGSDLSVPKAKRQIQDSHLNAFRNLRSIGWRSTAHKTSLIEVSLYKYNAAKKMPNDCS